METFRFESCVRGHHIHKNIWNPSLGEELTCSREVENTQDPFAVAVKRRTTIVGHVPRRISAACALFIERKGTITCKITGSRCFSADLPQGGLEVPCTYTFSGDSKDVAKIKKLVCPTAKEAEKENDPPPKKRKTEVIDVSNFPDSTSSVDPVWVKFKGLSLTEVDKANVISGKALTDMHINVAQEIIKRQFPHISGLQSTLVISKAVVLLSHQHMPKLFTLVEITGFSSRTLDVVNLKFWCMIHYTHVLMLKQWSWSLLCLTQAVLRWVSVQNKMDIPSENLPRSFRQDKMREHLVSCLDNLLFSVFP